MDDGGNADGWRQDLARVFICLTPVGVVLVLFGLLQAMPQVVATFSVGSGVLIITVGLIVGVVSAMRRKPASAD